MSNTKPDMLGGMLDLTMHYLAFHAISFNGISSILTHDRTKKKSKADARYVEIIIIFLMFD